MMHMSAVEGYILLTWASFPRPTDGIEGLPVSICVVAATSIESLWYPWNASAIVRTMKWSGCFFLPDSYPQLLRPILWQSVLPFRSHKISAPLMTLPVPISVRKSPRPTDESNLDLIELTHRWGNGWVVFTVTPGNDCLPLTHRRGCQCTLS